LLVAGRYSAACGLEGLLPLRRLSPPSRKISEFSTRRSAMAVAMVGIKEDVAPVGKGCV